MILRVLLAAVLAAALVAAATPAVHEARASRAAHLADRSASAVSRAVAVLSARNDPVPPGVPGARRTLRVPLPAPSLTTAPLASFTIGAAPGAEGVDRVDTPRADVLGYRVADGPARVVRLPVDVRTRSGGTVAPDGRALAIRGDAALTLRYVRVGGRPTVLVARRGFMRDDGTTPAHARTARPVP